MKISGGGWILVLAYYANEIKKDASEHLSCQPPYFVHAHVTTCMDVRSTVLGTYTLHHLKMIIRENRNILHEVPGRNRIKQWNRIDAAADEARGPYRLNW
jgi:hypothetical protein